MSANELKQELDLYRDMLDNNTINVKYYRSACKAAQKKHLALLQAGHTPPKQYRPIASPTKKGRRNWVPVDSAGVHKAANWETAKMLFLPLSVEGKQVTWITEAPSNAWMKGGSICVKRFRTTSTPVYRRRILKSKKGAHFRVIFRVRLTCCP